uniref:Exonuclease 3'-5' domain-containing protein 1 n=1 Tax=Magallana gigas TaxID=29159 RepID=K1RKW8_MAGGI
MANQAVEIVVETSRCRQIVSILSSESVLAVDCEGIALGVEGPMTLLQICTYSGDVYLFDVQENRELFSEGHLKIVLESDEILKVIHACSYDSAALYHQFGVTLQNVFDTQVADTVLEEHNERLLVSSLDLQELCQKYSSSKKVSDYKEQLKYSKKEGEFWAKRPLTDEMKSVAVGDVRALIPEVFETQKRLSEQASSDLVSNIQDAILNA